MDCTARGKGNESRRGDKGGMGWSNSGSDDDEDRSSEYARRGMISGNSGSLYQLY